MNLRLAVSTHPLRPLLQAQVPIRKLRGALVSAPRSAAEHLLWLDLASTAPDRSLSVRLARVEQLSVASMR
jgi:hypothetical protein